MKSIAIPTDFSECANHATGIGLELAKKLKTTVTFLHLQTTPVEWSKIPLEKESLYPETKASIGDAKDALLKLERQAEKTGVDADSNLVYNIGIEEIHKYINENHFSLVVMGTHGSKGAAKLMGTNTREVLSHSPVPVLAIKPQDKALPFKKMAVASDFKMKSREGFRKIMDLAVALELEIEVLFVNVPYNFTESDEIGEAMDIFLSDYRHQKVTKRVINANNEERGLEIYLKSANPGIIGTVTHGRSGLENLFRNSITEDIINRFNIPVLSISMKA